MAMAAQLDEFNNRLARISDPKNKSYYDPELKMAIPKRVSKELINRKKLKKAGFSALLLSLFVGAFALMLSHLACCRFGLIGHDAPVLIYGAAAIVAILIGGLLRLKTMPHMGAQFAGVGAMIAFPAAGRLTDARGALPVMRISMLALLVSVAAAGLAPSLALLCVAVFCMGACHGTTDISQLRW